MNYKAMIWNIAVTFPMKSILTHNLILNSLQGLVLVLFFESVFIFTEPNVVRNISKFSFYIDFSFIALNYLFEM